MYNPAILPFSDIYEAYLDCRKSKRNSWNALKFELDLESNLIKLWEDLLNKKYNMSKSIAFIVTEPRVREIFAADFRDRIIHHLVIKKLEPLFETVFIDDNCNCRIAKGTLYCIRKLSERINGIFPDIENYKDVYIGKFDLENFFMDINRPILWEKLEKFIKANYNQPDKEIILWLVKSIVLHCPEKNCIRQSPECMWTQLEKRKSLFNSGDNQGLPIGNLTSQVFANFLLSQFDIKFLDNGMAGRYVDDFYIIGYKQSILNSISEIKNNLSNIGIKLHRKKKYLQHISKGTSFLGTICLPGRVYVKNKTIRNALLMIEKYNRLKDKKLNIEQFISRLNSYLGYMTQFDSYGIRYQLYNSIDKDWFKYIYLNNSLKKASVKKRYKPQNIMNTQIRQYRFKLKSVSPR